MNGEGTPVKAYVSRDHGWDTVSIWLVAHRYGQRAIMLPHDPVFEVMSEASGAATVTPSLRLDEDLARALLDALAAYFGGTGQVQTLRRDYEAERKRVDQFINFVISRANGRTA